MRGRRLSTLLAILFGCGCGASTAQVAAPTLEDDWKALAAREWVNVMPAKSWGGLDAKWQDLLKAQGITAWSKVVVSFSGPPKKDRRIAWKFYGIKQGKESVEKSASAIVKLEEKAGKRYLVVGNPGSKIAYTLKNNLLSLDGVFGSNDDAFMPTILTGEYKAGAGKGVP